MAVVKIANTYNRVEYQGLSTDTKPSAASGTTFLEVNTGVRWKVHKGQWVEDLELVNALIIALREVGR